MKKTLACILALSTLMTGYALAEQAALTPKARYAEDKKLCAEESTSSARMQCLRDARAEYDKALVNAKANLKAANAQAAASPACVDCGKVIAVKVLEKEGDGTPLGMIAGGVAGAVLGHQVGRGRGKDLATIAGAAGGAYAGHKIEQNARSSKSWVVTVRLESGEERNFNFDTDPGYASGDLVKLSGSGLVRR